MLGINPVGPIGTSAVLSFDFPVGINATDCNGNVDPGGILDPTGHHPEVEYWYGQLGVPAMPQGWPCLCENVPEVEDPNVDPWIDLILDSDREAVIFHTGRLSGDLVQELADAEHEYKVIVHAIPYKAGTPVELWVKEGNLVPEPEAPNVWFWRDPNVHQQLIYTLRVDPFIPPDVGLVQGEVYKLLVEWEFYHTVAGTTDRHCERFCGFDDSITFKVGPATE